MMATGITTTIIMIIQTRIDVSTLTLTSIQKAECILGVMKMLWNYW